MTKRYTKTVAIALLVIVCAVLAFINAETTGPATQEKEIAKIGNYSITKSAFREYVFINAVDNSSVKNDLSLESIAREYAKAQIAAEEIAGTQYEVPSEQRKKFLEQTNNNAERDAKANAAFCQQYGISQEELSSIAVTGKMNTTIALKHLSQFMDTLKEKDKQQGREFNYASGELQTLYEEYLEKKVSTLEFVIVDEQSVKDVQKFLDYIFTQKEKR
ncbi:MAG: hypothetical protein E7527_02870 [Ruminococcaceae bacterium]|nr:hypothetical protein [Oscillospiraceae bacterium]